MRKYFIFIAILYISQLSFSQRSTIGIRKQLDSLQKVLPNLKDSARVDCLNRLAIVYDWIFSDKKSWDSSYAYSLEALALSKKLNYKKGIAYAYIQLASEQNMKIDDHIYSKKTDVAQLKIMIDSCENYCREAISTGEQLKNNDILGSAYWTLGGMVFSRTGYEIKDKTESEIAEEYLKKALDHYEKANDEVLQGMVCRDLFYVYHDRKDTKKSDEYIQKAHAHLLKAGDDKALGDFYFFNLRNIHVTRKDVAGEENDLRNAINYYEKVNETSWLSNAYSSLGRLFQKKNDLIASEEVFKRGIRFFQQTGNEEGESLLSNTISGQYILSGDFEKGFPYCERSIELMKKTLTGPPNRLKLNFATPYYFMARFYKIAGDYETALQWIHKCRQWYETDSAALGNWAAETGDIFRLMGNYDSAMFYLKPFESNTTMNFSGYGKMNLGHLYIDLNQPAKALPLMKESIESSAKLDKMGTGPNRTALGKAYFAMKNYQEALKNLREGLALLKNYKLRLLENYDLLSKTFEKLGRNDSALYYLRQYTILKDALLSRQFYWRLSNYKKQSEEERRTSQINLLNKDNQLKQQQLKQEATLKKGLIAGLILLLLLGIFIFRNLTLRRRNELEKQKLESGKKQAELEMQALRTQMNPHFIFNCLSSINRFILKNESKIASNYLTRFSRLMRMVLMNSQKPLIALDDELEMLEIYLEMERLRFKNSFDYAITFLNTIDSDNVFIPPLLLQPFCENAIWHGLMHKEGQGRLDIELSMKDNILNCTITDNGVGREKAEEMNSKTAEKEKSMRLKITTERLALFNKEKGIHTSYEIEDLNDENGNATGTKVILRISYKESIEELV